MSAQEMKVTYQREYNRLIRQGQTPQVAKNNALARTANKLKMPEINVRSVVFKEPVTSGDPFTTATPQPTAATAAQSPGTAAPPALPPKPEKPLREKFPELASP